MGRRWSGVHPSPIERGSGIVVLQCGEGRRRGLNIHTPGLGGIGVSEGGGLRFDKSVSQDYRVNVLKSWSWGQPSRSGRGYFKVSTNW